MLRKRNIGILLALLMLVTSLRPAQAVEQRAITEDPAQCEPLPPPSGLVINVSTVEDLVNAVNTAASGATIRVADGIYNLNGSYLRFDTPGVTLRSASGNREAVILDGNYQTTEIAQIVASNVTIADLTLREAFYHPIHVMSGSGADTVNTLIYNVHIIDPREQAIKINPAADGYYVDNGVIACSHIEMTDAGRPNVNPTAGGCYTGGVDAHQARGWVIRDNLIEGFWCDSGLSEHGIHMWRGCRDTTIERNTLLDNARGVGLGLVTSGDGRTYPDDPCPEAVGYVDDFGGAIRNNFIAANDVDLFASQYGFDCGICLWNACNARALHNTVYTADNSSTYSSIEWRFDNTEAVITNNLVNHLIRDRGGEAVVSGNHESALASWFVDASVGDLHLASTASTVIDTVTAPSEVTDDFDGDPRPIGSASDTGADEYGNPPPAAVTDLHVTQAITTTGAVTITLAWTPPAEVVSTTVRYNNAPISEVNWDSVMSFAANLPAGTQTYTDTLPYESGTLYFALRTSDSTGEVSDISNNAVWFPVVAEVWLPVVRR